MKIFCTFESIRYDKTVLALLRFYNGLNFSDHPYCTNDEFNKKIYLIGINIANINNGFIKFLASRYFEAIRTDDVAS